jgi:phosphatidylethanolamine/phosphatidyl-N-methylethanolamine N-methyltransferase
MHRMRQRLADYRVFWRQFRQAYHTTGAVLPSGASLCAALSHYVRTGEPGEVASAAGPNGAASNASPPRHILEVGPGTGAVTTRILVELRPDDRLTLVERNEPFVNHLRELLDSLDAFQQARDRIHLVHGSVEDLPDDRYDLIISGLPLNNFSVELVECLLAKMQKLLAPGGTLSFFEYVAIRRAKSLITSRADRERLRGIERVLGELLNQFEIRRDLVLANMPPAWVHHVRFTAGSTEHGAENIVSHSPLPAPCASPL